MSPDIFSEYLKKQRRKKQLRQEDLAKALHITRQAYSNYEQGRSTPTVQTLAELSILLEFDFFSLFLNEAAKNTIIPTIK